MKKILAASLLLSTLLFGSSILLKNSQDIDGFNSPESVFVNGKDVYVSNVGIKLEPLAKDNDGYISKLDSSGKIIEHKFISGMNAPKGMSIIGDVLYVVDIDVLKGFNLKNKKLVFELPITNAIFLNDIAVLDKNTLYVSDTGTGTIHQINLKNKTYKTLVALDIKKYGGPNGLLIDKKNHKLYSVGYDPIGDNGGVVISINLNTKTHKPHQISNIRGQLDGVAFDSKGNLLVSSWGEGLKGMIYSIDANGKATQLDLPPMAGPADIFYDGKYLWIPKMAENKVLKIRY
ncbi:ATP-binding protein [Helicobacter sp. 11S03491-1]|uniref:ATP-binding protein n=1 Tax=Helicobacter sp. 11S03491-1 TaxID=1476196 RepID=UPI000BA6FC6B|nr:ATP-binding protein [Helicobacter sp. 11S03491-1]PAF42275.1 ATP-binding protein [Helicobacter sp. 11S03491-1]